MADTLNSVTQIFTTLINLLKTIVNFIRENIAGLFPEQYRVFIYIAIALLIAEYFRGKRYVEGAGIMFMLILATIIFLILQYLPK